MVRLRGKVVSGLVEGSHWMKKLESYYVQKTGVELIPGTVAIQLDQPYDFPAVLDLDKEEYEGITLLPLLVNGMKVYLLNSYQEMKYSQTMIEIIVDMQVRESLCLSDGVEVEVIVPVLESAKLN